MSHDFDSTKVWETREPRRIVADLVATPLRSRRSALLATGFGVLALVGLVALVIKLVVDGGESTRWGYVATLAAVMLSFSFGGPATYVLSFIAKGVWGRTMARISSFFTLIGIITAVLMIPLALQLPPLIVDDIRRRSIWYEAPIYSPTVWMIAGILGFMVAGLALFYLSMLPDLAVMRDHCGGWRQRVGRSLARGWIGSNNQWRSWRVLNGGLGTIYVLLGVLVILLFASDFNMGLVPGWRDSLFPATFFQTSLQSGLAALIIVLWIVRRSFRLEKYLLGDQFWVLGRLLFAATLLWLYFFYSGFIVFWYGRSASDIATLNLVVVGPLLWATILSILFSFVVPFLILLWNPFRRSVNGPAIASVAIVIGILFERLRVNLAAWSVPTDQINEKYLTHNPSIPIPNLWDILIVVGGFAAIVALMMLALRTVPAVSIWKTLQFNMMTKTVKYLRTKGILIAKPD